MKSDENKFSVNAWWASSAQFVIYALTQQLHAAQAVFPELFDYALVKRETESPPPVEPPKAAVE